MYWVQDMKRMSINPEDQDIASADTQLAIENTDIHKNLFDNMDTSSKAADPGKLGNQVDWYTWSHGFVNYLSTIPGSTGIPLSYVVCESDEPTDLSDNDDYLTTLVGRAPLKGTTYVADHCQVHQLLTGKVLGEQAEEWICDDKNKQKVAWTLIIYVYILKGRATFLAESLKLKQFIKSYITSRNAP
jgi:hypothetical protein